MYKYNTNHIFQQCEFSVTYKIMTGNLYLLFGGKENAFAMAKKSTKTALFLENFYISIELSTSKKFPKLVCR